MWVLPILVVLPVLVRIRVIAEHYGMPADSVLSASRDWSAGPVLDWLLVPWNIRIHRAHHLFPGVPFHQLETAARLLREDPVLGPGSPCQTLPEVWRDLTRRPDDAFEDAWSGAVVDPSCFPIHRELVRWCHGRVVEVGPGLFPHSPAVDTTFVEPQPAAVSALVEAGRYAVVGLLEDLPFEDASVDAVLAFDVLEHCASDVRALSEVHRVSRPGGVLVVAVPVGAAYFGPLDVAVGHRFRYEADELLRKLDEAGFSVVEGRWDVPVAPWVKRATDRLQWLAIRLVGLRAALRAKAALVRTLGRRWPAVRLGPLPATPPTGASRATLVARRR